MPTWIPSAIGAGANLLGNFFGNFRKRKDSDRIYDRQRRDNLADWNRNNTYNSPQAQMKRFQEAGLNPNLIYGQGNSGPSGAIPTADAPNPDYNSPDAEMLSKPFMDFADLQIKKQQVDNMKLQADQITAQTALTSSQEMLAISNTADTKYNTKYKKLAQDNNLKLLDNRVENVYFSTDKMLADSARAEKAQTDQFKTSKLTRKLMQNQDALKEYEMLKIKFKSKGIKMTAAAIEAILKKFNIKY